MTQASSGLPMTRTFLISAVAWFTISVLFGLWEVRWSLVRLPAWFSAYALLIAVMGPLGWHLSTLVRPEQKWWQRVLMRAVGWGIPVSLLILGRDLMSGEIQTAAQVGLFVLTWTLGSAAYGVVYDRLDRSRFKRWV